MDWSQFSGEQVASALRHVESGTPVSDMCRPLGVSEAIFSVRKNKYARLGMAESRRLCQFDDHITRRKRLVADLTSRLAQDVGKAQEQKD